MCSGNHVIATMNNMENKTYREQLDLNRIPQHVAIIMDGNGRWAQQRGLDRTKGHIEGVEVVRRSLDTVVSLGIKYLTLYTFSTENWNRPQYEVSALMDLLLNNIEEEMFFENHVRLKVIGDMERLPKDVQKRLNQCIDDTKDFDRCTLVLALSYSSRWEITDAVKNIAKRIENGELKASDINESLLSQSLSTSFMPDPDLLVRTGGELRLSNYLLWQSAYTELYFTDTYWPDFDEDELCKALLSYQRRQRRFGLTGAQVEKTDGTTQK